MKPMTFMCFGALAMFSNIANAEICKDFDEDMNVIEYECGTSLQKALKQQKQKKIEQEQKKKESFSEDDFFADFGKKEKSENKYKDSYFGKNKNEDLKKYISANLIYAPSAKIKTDYENISLGNGYGFAVAAGVKKAQLRGDIEFKYLTGIDTDFYYHDEYGYYTNYSYPQYTTWEEVNVKETVKFSNINLMLNGYYDIVTYGAITPFVGIGFGLIHVSAEVTENFELLKWYDYYGDAPYVYTMGAGTDSSRKTYNKYAYHIGAGLSFKVNDSLVMDFSYRYNGTGKMDEAKMFNHELLLGGRVMF